MLRYVTAQSGRSWRLVFVEPIATIYTTTEMCKSLELKLHNYKVYPSAFLLRFFLLNYFYLDLENYAPKDIET